MREEANAGQWEEYEDLEEIKPWAFAVGALTPRP